LAVQDEFAVLNFVGLTAACALNNIITSVISDKYENRNYNTKGYVLV
jgi:hypothetical protein